MPPPLDVGNPSSNSINQSLWSERMKCSISGEYKEK